MKKKVKSPGSATVINAMATGFGSAFAIDLNIIAKAKTIPTGIKTIAEEGIDTTLMKYCVENVFKHYNQIEKDEFGIKIQTNSKIPQASGLSSSSASSNAIVKCVSELISEEYDLKPLTDLEIINLAIDSSLKAGVTITGSFDDASSSYFGGLTVTDNSSRKILLKDKFQEDVVLVYMPNEKSFSGDVDIKRIKLLKPYVKIAFEKALNKEYYSALTLNGILYCSTLGFNQNIALDALEFNAKSAGLSGSGPSFVAIATDENKDQIKESWAKYPGKIIETKAINNGTLTIK